MPTTSVSTNTASEVGEIGIQSGPVSVARVVYEVEAVIADSGNKMVAIFWPLVIEIVVVRRVVRVAPYSVSSCGVSKAMVACAERVSVIAGVSVNCDCHEKRRWD